METNEGWMNKAPVGSGGGGLSSSENFKKWYGAHTIIIQLGVSRLGYLFTSFYSFTLRVSIRVFTF